MAVKATGRLPGTATPSAAGPSLPGPLVTASILPCCAHSLGCHGFCHVHSPLQKAQGTPEPLQVVSRMAQAWNTLAVVENAWKGWAACPRYPSQLVSPTTPPGCGAHR